MFESDADELAEIRKSVQKLARSELPRFMVEGKENELPRPVFAAFAKLGLTGLSIPERFQGSAGSPLLQAAVLDEIARVDLGPAIFLSVHWMVSGLIAKFAPPELAERYLPKLADGTLLAAFALTEPGAGSDAARLATTAKRNGDDFELTGDKCYITSAGYADVYAVFARREGSIGSEGISAFVVEADTPGLLVSKPDKKMGCERSPIASLRFESCRVPAGNLIGVADHGYKVALGGLAGGRINIAACANGLSYAALERAQKHLEEREQFNKKLSEFQGLQFMLADMRMLLDAAQLLVQRAAVTLGSRPEAPENRSYPAIAKCFATDAAMKITTDAVQLLGGAGYIKDFVVEKLMRDAKMLQIVEGTNQIQRSIIAKEMRKMGVA